ncbi:MAG: CsiV family protein [Pseudomonadota bacterium]
MTTMQRFRLILSLCCALMTPALVAQPEPRWFSIEVIVFEQYMSPGYAEYWPDRPEIGFPENLVRFPSESQNNSLPEFFSELPFDAQLQKAKKKIERARDQRVLFSRRWEQGLLDKENAPYIYIRGGDRAGPHRELEGSLQISVERYLHVKSKLWLTRFKSADSVAADVFDTNTASMEVDSDIFLDDLEPFALPEPPFQSTTDLGPSIPIEHVFLFDQERRLRSKETHYLDHPLLGMLIRIEPLPDEARSPKID